ncbi:MAG: PorV/PorQ family protein [Candidatus Marinimicrobia bacterium]|jgi:hypothetical protein|nr:hypothetical protein [Candidatus Neomarinimicrobiota bacterium]MDP7484263.1 PorV/PorQ family protein [Candidatus Neomarinimicrobiota bacterium]MDP7654036.1 PorV/PorQ family protein [Candidatus Neomarinimicrobiota bacterium]|tara:strand:- start:614 stop:1624 length:1011 start_codon:yes stop_codon:yes gene_type:complete
MKTAFRKTVILALFPLALSGQQNFFPILGGQRVGTSVFTFLKIGVSARAAGMGEAVVALHQDASSLVYNPAAIGQLSGTQVSTSRVQWPADITYDFLGVSRQLAGGHTLGVSAGILHMAPMQETTEYMPHGTGNYFIFQDRFIGLSYSVRMSDRFSFGITLKHAEENLAGHQMRSMLLDVGTFYWTGFRTFRFSAVLSNFGLQARPEGSYKRFVLDRETGDEVIIDSEFELFSPPTIFRVGSAMEVIESQNHSVTVSLQLNHPVDNAENMVTGIEYLFLNTLALRGGYKINVEEEDFSVGAGFYVPVGPAKLRVDFAYTNLIHLSNPTRLSLAVEF